jgi:hypothetical protein
MRGVLDVAGSIVCYPSFESKYTTVPHSVRVCRASSACTLDIFFLRFTINGKRISGNSHDCATVTQRRVPGPDKITGQITRTNYYLVGIHSTANRIYRMLFKNGQSHQRRG